MTKRAALLIAASLILAPGLADAGTLRWAAGGDVSSMDPYARNETFLITFTANIYEPLARRNKQLALEPALATAWGQTGPTTWFFDLRQGVTFSDGTPFTADDVVFSLGRAQGDGSNMQAYFSSVQAIRRVGEFRVEVDTKYPDPLLAMKWASLGIMSKAWAERNNAATAADMTKNQENFATRNAMGTGPFMLKERKPEERTVLVPNPGWWDRRDHNLDEVIFTPVGNPATRVAALKAGNLDMIYEVPPADTDGLRRDAGLKVIEGPETRVVFVGMDQERPELPESNIKGRNPFQDRRVREAVYRSIDVEAIKRSVMRGQSYPTASLVAPVINGYVADLDRRPAMLKPEDARKLLADAGYPDGFEVGLDCSNDRYVNDDKICVALVPMLARIGIKVTANAQTRNKFFAKIMRKGDYSPGVTSMYLMAWSPGSTYDVHNVLDSLLQTPSAVTKKGQANIGGYSNKALDELADRIERETDKATREQMIRQATKIYMDDYAYVPLHQQALVWAASTKVELFQPADNTFPLRYVTVK